MRGEHAHVRKYPMRRNGCGGKTLHDVAVQQMDSKQNKRVRVAIAFQIITRRAAHLTCTILPGRLGCEALQPAVTRFSQAIPLTFTAIDDLGFNA